MDDMKAPTFGSAAAIFATAIWCSRNASKEMSCAASVMPKTWPVSSSGKNPLGITTNRARVATSTASDTLSVASRWRMTVCKLRS